MVLQHVMSYTANESKRFLIGLIGQGPALDALALIMGQKDFMTAFPRFKLAGWVPEPEHLSDDGTFDVPQVLQQQPLFSDIPSLFMARPGMMLAVDLSPDARHMEAMRSYAAPSVSLVTADALMRFCAAAEDGRLAIGGGESLRKAEKLFALLLEQMDGDILILDNDGTIQDANRHAAASRNMTHGQLVGKNYFDLDEIAGLCSGAEVCPFETARDTGKHAQHTFAHVLPNGTVRYLLALCYPVTDAFGEATQYLYIQRDVTEQQQLEKRLQQTEKMAAIGELSTYMAHEIRNPLFSIGGFANALLRNPSLNDLAREKARIIYDESRRLDEILTSILNFARPTEQTLGVFDPAVVARQTIDLMSIGSEERGIQVMTEIAPNLPKARGNAENLKQCLINLVKNAMEAMPEGGKLGLRVHRNTDYVRLDVTDTGQGIAPELHDQVFSPFFTTKNGGAGLGLAMTRKVIEDMGGKVLLESQPGKGSKISLLVPMALAVDTESTSASVEI